MVLLGGLPELCQDDGELLGVRTDLHVVCGSAYVICDGRDAKRTSGPTRSMTTPSVSFRRIFESVKVTSPNSWTISSIAFGSSGTKTVRSKSQVSHLARLRAAVRRMAVSVESLRPSRWTSRL